MTMVNNLPAKFVIAILAVGILIGAATTTTVISGGLKPSNLALAQIRIPSATIGPSGPVVSTGTANSAAGPPFGPSCTGCITTQNLANGAVTNPKLGPLSVSSGNIGQGQVTTGNIGAGQVATGNIADQAVTTQKLAPGAVSVKVQQVLGKETILTPGEHTSVFATCPLNSVLTGGGYSGNGLNVGVSGPLPGFAGQTQVWEVVADNPTNENIGLSAIAMCLFVSP